MIKRKVLMLMGVMTLLAGCGNETKPVGTVNETVTETQSETAAEIPSSEGENEEIRQREGTFASVSVLLGMQDSETESMLGGGEENWTEDRSFYIGRIFQAEIYGEICPVYTTCSKEGVVESVSLQIVSGERKVTEEEVEQWAERISDYTGVDSSEESGFSEGGSRQRSWRKDGKIVTLRYMADNLSISFQNLVGELNKAEEKNAETVLTEKSEIETSVAEKPEESGKETVADNQRSDNFDVDAAETEAFAIKIKEAVAGQDLEKLAELIAFPVYIRFEENGQFIESKEDFIALGKDNIFTETLMESIAGADETLLPPSRAGFVLTKEKGAANIVFGLREGELAISGFNY